jgi:protein phosphatase inhibitor 2
VASSRSTSFNLPAEAKGVINSDGRDPGGEVEIEEEMDEESTFHAAIYTKCLTHGDLLTGTH